jgi:hypothetical protein
MQLMASIWQTLCIECCLLLAAVTANAHESDSKCSTSDDLADVRAVFIQRHRVRISHDEQLEATEFDEKERLGCWQSSIMCVGVAGWNQSCKIRNAYVDLSTGNIKLMIHQNTSVPDLQLHLLGVPGTGSVDVSTERYTSGDHLVKNASSLHPSRVDGLTLYVYFLWTNNWAHGMFDGFWPGYVALAKFGKHTEPFHVLAQDSEMKGCSLPENESLSMSCSLRHTLGRFARNNATWPTQWIGVPQQEESGWLLMEELILGSQGGGEFTSVGGLPGSLASLEPLSALPAGTDLVKMFANRMYRTHGIPELINKKSSMEGVAGRKLRVLITDNERHTAQDRASMNKYIETRHGSEKLVALTETSEASVGQSASAKADAVAMLNQRLDIEAYYVDWSTYFPLSRQLHVIRHADIHMTSTGTALFYSVFFARWRCKYQFGKHVLSKLANLG